MPKRPSGPVGGFVTESIKGIHDWALWSLVQGKFTGPDGATFTRSFVTSPGAVGVVALQEHGAAQAPHVVLVRQYRYAMGLETLEVPAGALDADEEPLDCARRELGEETLLRSDEIEPLGEFCTSPGRMNERGYVFLARNCIPDPTAAQHEPTLPIAMPLADAIAMIGGELLAATSCLALLLAQRRLAGLDR